MLLAVMATLALGGWGLHVMQVQFRLELANRLGTGLDAMAAGLETWRSQRVREVQGWAAHDEVVAALDAAPGPGRAKALNHLDRELDFSCHAMGYLGYLLLDAQGRVLIPAGAPAPEAAEEREAVGAGRPWLTHPFLGRVQDLPGTERPLIDVSAPVRNARGGLAGVLVLRMPGDALSRELAGGQPGRTGETLAFDRSGRLLSDSRFEDQVRGAGLIGSDPVKDRALLQLVLRDPGGDLVKGFKAPSAPGTWLLTRDVAQAVAGQRGEDLDGYRDYRGVLAVGAWRWVEGMDLGLTM
ncbi:MAG TPA: cache domain-containing protein, partial [Holophagaceae bacterium]|nr:cache domain-containing protein [Holophagaceae bacterium]